MNILLFGATGMVGQGALRAALADPATTEVRAVVRRSLGMAHPKLREVVHVDFADWSAIVPTFTGVDACIFALGTSSLGMDEAAYRRTTFDLTLGVARMLLQHSPGARFCFVSGQGTNTHGAQMWARVKGETEDALTTLFPGKVFHFRPGYIQPIDGVTSNTGWVRAAYAVLGPVYPLLKRAFPKSLTDNGELGRALMRVARTGFTATILENQQIIEAASLG
jgi:uncharacterized protein YbjT (DUF2867 family)